MSVIHAPKEPELSFRQLIFLAALGVALVVFILRLWYLQVVRSEDLSLRAENYRRTVVDRLAPRGLIVDRNGELMAGVRQEAVLTVLPGEIRRNPWLVPKLAAMIGVPEAKLKSRIDDHNWRPWVAAPVHVGLPVAVATRIAEAADQLPGVSVELQPMRFYPDPVSFCHLLGYVWAPGDKDLERLKEQDIKPADYVGKDGLERVYERELMGAPGQEVVEIDSSQHPQRVVERDNATPGNRLVLSIDARLQRLALQLLAGRRGAVVAIDPSNGDVLALASAPTYDSSLFIGGISPSDWANLLNDPNKPLINRAVSSRYAPGSTFKIVTAMAAYDAGAFTVGAVRSCNGYYEVGNRRMRCLGHHGLAPFRTAFAKSCNVYFAELAMRAGPERVKARAQALGLGRRTGIDLPSENRGVVPTQEWLAAQRPPRRWYPGDTVNIGVGQGEMAATPLQMADLMAFVANRGIAYRPRLVRAVGRAEDGFQPKILEPVVAAQEEYSSVFWHELTEAMVSVVESGSARVAQIPGLRWGGKTGSAEHRRGQETHSWFVGMAPIDKPRIVIAVMVEAAGHGSEVAAPIAREVVRDYLFRAANSAKEEAKRVASDAASFAFPALPALR